MLIERNKGEKSIILLFEIRFELETSNSSLIIIRLEIKSEIRVRFERNFSVTGRVCESRRSSLDPIHVDQAVSIKNHLKY